MSTETTAANASPASDIDARHAILGVLVAMVIKAEGAPVVLSAMPRLFKSMLAQEPEAQAVVERVGGIGEQASVDLADLILAKVRALAVS